MKAESIVYTIAGMCFGIILGWIIATQQPARTSPAPEPTPTAQPPAQGGGAQQAKVLDEARVQQLTTILNSDPKNVGAIVQLGNTYFDAERYPDAIKWYEQALTIDPKNADASTDLGVSYYYTNRPDDALKQFDNSLRIEASLRQVGSPVLFVVSRKDPYAARSARELSKDATGRRETFFGEAASHGVPLLAAEPDLARMLVDWFQRALGVN